MSIEFREKAYAKVNFNLEVLPKREDGFHPIKSIFQTIDLYDELIVTVDENLSKNSCVVTCDSMILPEKNTITSAYEAFCHVSEGEVPGIRVKLIKGIPAGGGLGGGSSDAAALIRILQKICSMELSVEQLDYIAGKTGSDVFFFMHCNENGAGCALVSGRGEIIENIKPRKDLYILLIFPDVFSSTKEAYEMVDQKFLLAKTNEKDVKIEYPLFEDLEFIYRKDPQEWVFINTFTPVLCSKYVAVNISIETFKNRGADFTDLSGSGSTVFGVYKSKEKAKEAEALIAETFSCKLVSII